MTDAIYFAGRLSEATNALSMPISSVQAQVHAVYRCAKEAPNAVRRQTIEEEIQRLESATATLREILDLGKPALRLVAAE